MGFKAFGYNVISLIWDSIVRSKHYNVAYLVAPEITPDEISNLSKRLNFYCPELKLEIKNINSAILSCAPILYFCDKNKLPTWIKCIRGSIYYIDYRSNPVDGWEWISLANLCSSCKPNIEDSKIKFTNYINDLRAQHLSKCYIFGTGSSLEKAIGYNFSDGYRVVCNTIVKDKKLWNHLNPNFIVAGDAIYHFGHTMYARTFRKDLYDRMQETPTTYFIYPQQFHTIVYRQFKPFEDRLIPVPVGNYKYYHNDLVNNFYLPALGNVLQLLLLPLACTLSKNVYMWGFDGRAPQDKLFWKNSEKHSYSNYLPELQKEHPKFYEYYVPKDEPTKYINNNFGDEMDELLHQAEINGFSFTMMHKSWTPTLMKRFRFDQTASINKK
ncbi:hypothetical protein EO98_01315 [Methanosarcina sp. 2.H.T.1A.6]|uniref:hypothetical protein n=1 Tax=unclassified Methanosarcina TaxID=2644672 RepID=UPI0006211AC6|nr:MULTISPECIES: hypothetical protein [unclassified Methanosarcina]KKG09823.1 hypothetical protein EO97_01415 [Methanosarcina sp. 2.H.T.1A.15]KKG14913.1 hypothetical protein EO94_13380 [Methanosarcina sp. 2.H.T.1A.3]KKG21039.1 hypothetical protein EO98_01315 [Methanosarcina sp. 2.H.T.1A.6]KKG27288.1 hypothetical protein EO96_10150 [Methanosarcina sp. 2.H.T.1A.8]